MILGLWFWAHRAHLLVLCTFDCMLGDLPEGNGDRGTTNWGGIFIILFYYIFSKRVLSCDPTVTLWDFTLWARRARALVLRTLDRTLGGLPAAGCVNPARHMEAADLCRRNW